MNATNRNPALFSAIGLFTAFLFMVVWIAAAENDPSWVLGENTLSELGISDVDLTADLFEYGCIVSGILLFIFGMGKAYSEDDSSRVSGILLAVSALFLVLVGSFNMNYGNGNIHDLCAWMFFIFLMLAVIVSAKGDWEEGKRISAVISAVLFLIVIAVAVGNSFAYTEAVAVVCGMIWIIAESVKMMLSIKAGNPVKIRKVA